MFTRKAIMGLALFFLFAFVAVGQAAVGIQKNGTLSCTATDINFNNVGSAVTCGGSVAEFELLLIGGGNDGYVSMATDNTTISANYGFILKEIANDAAYQASTLPDGKPGQMLGVYITAANGGSWTVTPTTSLTFTSVVFNAAADYAVFWYVSDSVGWVVYSYTSVTINGIQ